MPSCIFSVVFAVCCCIGCDRDKHDGPASSASPAPKQSSANVAEDNYDKYRLKVQPLTDALLKMEILIIHPATLNLGEFDKEIKSIGFARSKVDLEITEEDKQRKSYKAMIAANTKGERALDTWQTVERLIGLRDKPLPKIYPHDPDALEQLIAQGNALKAQNKANVAANEADDRRIKLLVDMLVDIAGVRRTLQDRE